MYIEIKAIETDGETREKAAVHRACWLDAYRDLVSADYLDRLTPERCEKIAFALRDCTLIAKDGGRVVGFSGFGKRRDDPEEGEIVAVYVLREYYGTGVGKALLDAAAEKLGGCRRLFLWCLDGNERALRFYEKNGFRPDGGKNYLDSLKATEIRLVRDR